MAKVAFKANYQGQGCLFPLRLDEKIPQNSPARLVNKIVDELDLGKIFSCYSGGGCSSYDPRMMLKVVLYAYLNNIYSCRKIANALLDRVSFMWLAGTRHQITTPSTAFAPKN